MEITEEKSCTNKFSYESKLEGDIKIRHMVNNGDTKQWEMHSYYCGFCGKYHIGHADKKTQELVKSVVQRPKTQLIRMKKK